MDDHPKGALTFMLIYKDVIHVARYGGAQRGG